MGAPEFSVMRPGTADGRQSDDEKFAGNGGNPAGACHQYAAGAASDETSERGRDTTASSGPVKVRAGGVLGWLRKRRSGVAFWVSSKPQLAFFIILHTLATLAVFAHFFLKKWRAVDAALPRGAPRYWQKHTVPPVEFGAMHCLLLQMVLLPLTMCRNAFTRLRSTPVNRYLPLDDATACHAWLGFVMFAQITVAIALFFFHFGTLCADQKAGNEVTDFCANFTTEIMLTGYGIGAMVWAIGVTSALRHRIAFEAFKYTHYLLLPLYAVTIVHTLDAKGRSGMHERSQAWFWLLVPALCYVLDRLYGWRTTRTVRIEGGDLFEQADTGNRGMVLRLQYPDKFEFEPGQYVRINVPSVSRHEWHAFSIMSAPRDRQSLELYVAVVDGGWTERLYQMLQDHIEPVDDEEGMGGNFDNQTQRTLRPAALGHRVKIDGPFGSTFQDATQQKSLMLVSSGSGVVPFLSLLKHIRMSERVLIGDSLRRLEVVPRHATALLDGLHHNYGGSTALMAVTGDTVSSRLSDIREEETGLLTTNLSSLEQNGPATLFMPVVPVGKERRELIAEHLDDMEQDFTYQQANRHIWTYAFFLLATSVDLLLLCLTFTWLNLGIDGAMAMDITCYATLAIILINGWHVAFWRKRHRDTSALFLGRDFILLSLMLLDTLEGILYAMHPNPIRTSVTCLFRVFRICWTLQHTALFLDKPTGAAARQFSVRFLQRVSFVWSCRIEAFMSLAPYLMELAEDLARQSGPEYLKVHVFISREATAEDRQDLLEFVEGSALEGCLTFQHNSGDKITGELCEELCQASEVGGSVGIYFCGNKQLAKQLRASVKETRDTWADRNRSLVYRAENIY